MAVRSAAVIIRFCYPDPRDDSEVAWRVSWMLKHVLPRIRTQIDVEIPDIWLWVHPRHRELGKILGVGTFIVESSSPLEGRHPWATVRDLPRYRVQLRLDSDDLIGPRYVWTMMKALHGMGGRRKLVHAQPYKVDARTGLVYWCAPGSGKGHYSSRKISAFCVLKQDPEAPDYEWVYSVGHTKLWTIADAVAPLVREGHCWATCHAFNDSTQIYPYDRRIGKLDLS